MDNETNLKSAYDSLQKKELEQRKTIKQMSERIKELEALVSKNESLHDVTQRLNRRQLIDRIEEYSEIIEGKCKCGEKVNKVLNSSCTGWKNGDRYHYPKDNTAWCIFRCESCNEPIHETFKSDSDVG